MSCIPNIFGEERLHPNQQEKEKWYEDSFGRGFSLKTKREKKEFKWRYMYIVSNVF
jgi:hypothetical protein